MKKSILALAIAISSFSPLSAMQHHYGERNSDNWQRNSCTGGNMNDSQEDYSSDSSDRRDYRGNKFDRSYFERKAHGSRQADNYNADRRERAFRQSDNNSDFNRNERGSSQTAGNPNSMRNQDDFIAKQIDKTLASGWFSKGYDNVSYDVDNGMVVLTGDVNTRDEKIKIQKEVAKIQGVQQIDNQIVVNDTKNSGKSDEEVGQEIFNTLKSGWFSKGYDKVTFEVNNGRVMLIGRVEKMDDKNNIEKSLAKIEGIRDIDNQIVVAGERNNNETGMRSDKEINKEINKEIKGMIKSSGSGKESEKIAFTVNSGVVTLTGSVDSMNDKIKIEKKLSKINGIKKVDNQLTVNENAARVSE